MCQNANDRIENLAGAGEHRCCREINEAESKMIFDGVTETTPCITQHEDFLAMTYRVLLTQVGPLLKDQNNRSYKQRAGQSQNE